MTNSGETVVLPQDELPSLIESLRVPPGSDPRFATMESIAANYEASRRDISHNDRVDGFFACLDYLPVTRTMIVALSNLIAEGNQATPGKLALDTELARLGIDEHSVLPSEGGEIKVAEGILRGYAGHHCSDDPKHPVGVTLKFRDGRLFIQNEGASSPKSLGTNVNRQSFR
jgi:hypothetical protein